MWNRRKFLANATAGVGIIGFAPLQRVWAHGGQGHGGQGHGGQCHGGQHGHGGHSHDECGPIASVPHLDGVLVSDPASLDAASTDVGGIVSLVPRAVLRPGSVQDVIAMVRFCKQHHIPVSVRGQGHSTHGQAQVDCGLLVDMSTLAAVGTPSGGTVVVQGGATWRSVLEATVPLGWSPPVLTGFQGLSVGGTLSMGGVSVVNEFGMQVDHVKCLDVVTGEGVLRQCSSYYNRDLFDAVRGGIGQYGIIVGAKLELVPIPSHVRHYVLTYTDQSAFLADFRKALARREFDAVWGLLGAQTGFVWTLNFLVNHNPASPPNDGHLLRGYADAAEQRVITDLPYLEYHLQQDFLVEFLISAGLWNGVQHPWFDVFLGDQALDGYLDAVVPTLTPDDIGLAGVVLLFAARRSKIDTPLLRVPSSNWVYLFDILTSANAPGFDAAFTETMLLRNRQLYDLAKQVGGTRYPIGSIDFDHDDWRQHYGNQWNRVRDAKARYDPQEILGTGVGIF